MTSLELVLNMLAEATTSEIHKNKKYKGSLLFLPPYSPDYNPIEKVWANMKKGLVDIIPKCKTLEESILLISKNIAIIKLIDYIAKR